LVAGAVFLPFFLAALVLLAQGNQCGWSLLVVAFLTGFGLPRALRVAGRKI
jgi:hypothetical protein